MTAPGAPARLLDRALRIRPGEGRRTALLFFHLLLASAVFFLGRTVRDTLFLTRYPLSALPWMFVAYGVVSAAIALVYARIADRIPRRRLAMLTCAAGAATYLGAWAAVRADVPYIYPAFYVWTEIVASLFLVQFWTLAGELHDARSARRLFGTIGSARLLASVVVGLGTGVVVRQIGTAQLILVLVALILVMAAVAATLGGEARTDRAARPAPRPAWRAKKPLLADPYIGVLALLVLLAFTAVNVGDYQFKAIARATYSGDELARFFAHFYAISGAAAFIFQLVVTPRLLAGAGVGAGLSVMPVAFGLSSAALLAWPKIWIVSLLKFSDLGFQYTIQDTTFQALYVPFGAATRTRARALLEALVKPLGFALAGAIVLTFGAALAGTPNRFSLVSLPLVAAWLALIPTVRRRYLHQLEGTLSARGTLALEDGFVLDSAGREMLVRTLREGTPRQRLVALEQLGDERSPDVTGAVLDLVDGGDAAVRVAALEHLAVRPPAHADAAELASVRAAVASPAPGVRAAAALALSALDREAAVPDLTVLLADADWQTRGNALAGLLRNGGASGAAAGSAELRRLLGSSVRDDLLAAARAVRYLGRHAWQPLEALLANPDATVRRAALRAAAGNRDARLVPTLIGLLGDPACRAQAGQALIGVGEHAAAPLADLLDDERVPRPVRLEVPRLLRRISQPVSYQLLRQHVGSDDSRLRLRLFAALSHLRQDLGLPREPVAAVAQLVETEIADAERNRIGWMAARPRFSSPLLDELFQSRRDRVMRRVLRILALRYDLETLALVREHIRDPARRANALEMLDALLDAPLRAIVMPFADDGRSQRSAGPTPDPVAFITAHCSHPNPYVVLLALDALARAGEPEGAVQGAMLKDHPDPLVREGAARAVAAGNARLKETPMRSTLEKILFLKSTAIFERVLGEDLAPVARIAELQSFGPGDTIVHEGEQGDALFIIVSGSAAVERGGNAITTLGPGDSVGEMSVLDSEPRSATVKAVVETEALRIGSEEFYEILHEQVEIAEGVIRVLCRRLRQLDEQLAS